MRVIRVQASPMSNQVWSSENPAPASALKIQVDALLPEPAEGEILVQVKATTVIRDNLTWPELYTKTPAHPGNDFSGIVIKSRLDQVSVGDEVFGMISADRGGSWAEYVVVLPEELYQKPRNLSWEEAAAIPLSALTADQALFSKGGLNVGEKRKILVTGAAGAVGIYCVQFAVNAGCTVVAATSSRQRNEAFLADLGVNDSCEYGELDEAGGFDLIIDTVGGEPLKKCWNLLLPGGRLVSIDSNSWNFVNEHKALGLGNSRPDSSAEFFIVEPSSASLKRIYNTIEQGAIKVLVSGTFKFNDIQEAYELASSRNPGRGRIVLVP